MGTSIRDDELMRRVVARDQAALMALYERYGNLVYSLAYRVLRNAGLAEEATQDTFLKVWHKSVQWDPARGQLSSWLLTITRYASIDRLRKEQRQTALGAADLDSVVDPPSTLGRVGEARWFDRQVLRQMMEELPTEQAQVIELAFFVGMTHSELAEHLDWPLGTVKTRLRLGLKKLRARWQEAHSG
ncbi:MAG: RNA polymerase sigma factor [Anaerolineae bacterium]|jgi:RNA polymerase sigma-70 factor (ECF subfamily)